MKRKIEPIVIHELNIYAIENKTAKPVPHGNPTFLKYKTASKPNIFFAQTTIADRFTISTTHIITKTQYNGAPAFKKK